MSKVESDAIEKSVEQVVGPVRRLFRIAQRVVEELGKDDLAGVAAQMTYYFMLALFPALILLVGLLDALPIEANVLRMLENMMSGLPEEVSALLTRYLSDFAERRPSGSLWLWVLAALWATTRGIRGARKGLNRVFRCRPQSNLAMMKLQDIGLTLAGFLLMGLAYLTLLGGKQLIGTLTRLGGWDVGIGVAWQWLRLPVSFLAMTSFVVLAYRYLPSRRIGWRLLFTGALPTVLAWMLLGGAFRFWLQHLGNFDQLYGGLASFFLLMFFLWLVSLVLLLGGEVTARLADRRQSARKPEEANR